MDFLGIGPVEIALVVLIAFIVLGPERIPGVMRQLGKWTRQLRETVEQHDTRLQRRHPANHRRNHRPARRDSQHSTRSGQDRHRLHVDNFSAADQPLPDRIRRPRPIRSESIELLPNRAPDREP